MHETIKELYKEEIVLYKFSYITQSFVIYKTTKKL